MLDLAVCLVLTAKKPSAWLGRLLDWPPGKYWPVVAAILPALIPIARNLEENAPWVVQGSTVAALLLAVAVLQFYGQERNNRDRIKTEDRFTDLFNELREGRRSAAALADAVNEQGIEVRRIADGIAALAAQAEEAIEEES